MSTLTVSLRRAPLALTIAAAGLIIATAPPLGTPPIDVRAGALIVGTIGLWASGLLAESLTALIFFTVAMLARIAPPEVVFSGLVSSAFWLIFSGLIIGAAIKQSGLGDRIAARLATALGQSYRGAMIGVVLFGLTMAFLMPSAMGRIALMLPILAALAEHLGYARQSRACRGLILGGVFGTYLPSSAILPANVPNNVLAGIVETTFGRPIAFGDYLLVHFPILGLAKTVMLIAVLLIFYRGEARAKPTARTIPPMSAEERRLALLLAVALLFWATDSLHHISPAWIGMALAVTCLFPPLRLLPRKALQTINLEPVFYVAGIISLGALATHSGLGEQLARWVLTLLALPSHRPVANFADLCGLSSVVGLLTTLPGVPAVMTPLTTAFAAASGLTPATLLIAQVVGFSTVILPYQAPPLVMAMQLADLPRRDMTVLCLITAALTVLILWPLDILWLEWLGRLAM
jgi:di/tricarboxylate transporter